MQNLKIGNLKLKNPLILGPMAGVNCTAFRQLCHEYGAALVYTQLYDSDMIVSLYDDDKKKFEEMLNISKEERPITIQIVGSNPEKMGASSEILSKYGDLIDINLGCPDNDVLAKRAGAFFSKHPEQIKKIAVPVIENAKVPVTAKIRIGWDEKNINVIDSCKILEELGIDAIAIHARTRKQVYSGKAEWDWIKRSNEKSNVPIIGNGDVFKPGAAKAMLDYTKCDFVMIARGAIGNPFIFDIAAYLLEHGKNKKDPSLSERWKTFMRFTELYKKLSYKKDISEFRQHAMWFTKSVKDSRGIRRKLMDLNDFDRIVDFVEKFFIQ